jgi:tetratricopeptide (TPR) repeat protein
MLAAALFAAVLASAPAEAVIVPAPRNRTLVLGPAQMFRLAEVAIGRGDRETALAIYAALESNPDAEIRAEARFRHAKQLLGDKRNQEAAVLLRRLLDEKPRATAARLELAHALQLLGDTDGALREVRAVQASGLPPAVARLVDRYSEALRAQRPFGASFEVSVAPDSNINRATRSDTLGTVLGDFEIAKDAKARSGTGLALNGQMYRRLPLGPDDSLLFRLSGLADLYRRTEFNDITADVAVGPDLAFGRDRLQLELGASQRWYGQKPFMRSARIAATFSHPLGSTTLVRLSGSAALVDNQLNDLQDGKAYSARMGVEHALSADMGIGGNISLDRQALRDPGYSTSGWRAGLFGWHDVGRMTFTAEAEVGELHADERLALFPDRRSDRFVSLSLGATFRQLQWHGFAPVSRFTVERNRSSVGFYDYRRVRSEVGVVRAF